MVQGFINHSHGGGVGFSDSDGFQNSLIDSVNVNQDGYGADKKRIKLMGSDQHQVGSQIDLFGDIEPLGLSLKMTPSFINLIESKLFQEKATPKETNQISKRPRSRATDMDSEKLKASNFTATLLKIGNWERVARNEGDLVAKCYYAKRKLVWEVLENGLKSKIEILWSDISAIRASFPEQQPATLELELKNEPKFYREHNPQPRKHTLWHEALDFTGGQAKLYRRHYLQFPEGTLEKHFEKLLQYDKELLKLSHRKFPVSNSPYFQSDSYESHQDFYLDFKGSNQHQHKQFPSMLQFSHLAIQNLPVYPVSKFNQATGLPPFVPNDSTSPMSVMDMPFFDESMGHPGTQQQRTSPFMEPQMLNDMAQPIHMTWANQSPELQQVLMASHNQIGQFIHRFESDENLVRGDLHSNNYPSESVYDHLLNGTDQTQHILNEQRLLAKVHSMACLLEAATTNEHNPRTQNTSISQETNNSMESSSTEQSSYGNAEWSNEYQDPTSWVSPADCNGDPFMNLPRTPSFPSLLFDTSVVEDFSNVNHQQWR